MVRRKAPPSGDWLFPNAAGSAEPLDQSSLLDVVDRVLNKGAVVNGDLVLGVANVDLIYAKLSVLLSALDRAMGETRPTVGRRRPGNSRGTNKTRPKKSPRSR